MIKKQEIKNYNLSFTWKTFLIFISTIYFFLILQDLVKIFSPFFKKSNQIPGTFALSVIVLLIAFFFIFFGMIFPGVLKKFSTFKKSLGFFRWLASIIVIIAISWFFLYSKWSVVIDGKWLRSGYFIAGYLVISWLLSSKKEANFDVNGLLIAGIMFGTLFQVINELKTVTSYPFSIGWSEGNRIWDYSVLFGKHLYNYPQDQDIYAYIDLGRQTLWGLPFLFPNPSIFFVRLWNVILYIVPYFLFGLLVFSDRNQKKNLWILISFWVFLFIHQGPIYTPLILVAMLVYTTKYFPTWIGFFVSLIAGLYALYSRQTWMFAPAMWSALIAFLETSPKGIKNETGRWLRAITLGIGGILGGLVIGNFIVFLRTKLAEDPSTVTGTINLGAVHEMVSKQPLLWNRLLPNATNPFGILPALLLAVVPLIILLVLIKRESNLKLNIWQKLLIFGELAAFLIVGIIASVKIGGGDNLHNLDMFLITLLLLASLVWKAGGKEVLENICKISKAIQWLLLFVVLIPASQGMLTSQPIQIASKEEVQTTLKTIQTMVDQNPMAEKLFIDQRQLLTFGDIKNVTLVPEYEKKVLMDMAMANDSIYFEKFYADLAAHRFSLIVSQPVYITFQDVEHEGGFGSENNTWVQWVSIPMLCYYEPVVTETSTKVQLLIPRTSQLPEDMIKWCEPYIKR